MRFYVYYDSYGNPRKAITHEELKAEYNNDPDEFLRKTRDSAPDAGMPHATAHVGTLSFESEKELQDFLDSLGEEIEGFYTGASDSRPYNF
jgi:hypothetical protein